MISDTANDSRHFRVFFAVVGEHRKHLAQAAWDRLDPSLLDEEVFADGERLLLYKALTAEKSRRQAQTLLPQPAAPDAETLPPISVDEVPDPSSNFLARMAAASPAVDFDDTSVVVDNVPQAKVIQLPLLPEQERAAPNAWLRSALFRVLEKGARTYHKSEQLPAWGGAQVWYTGETLDQGDLDVAAQCVYMANHGELGRPVGFSDRGMLKALGRTYGTGNLRWLHESMLRLRGCIFEISDEKGRVHTENLLTKYVSPRLPGHEKDGERVFTVNPVVAKFFLDDDYTLLHWKSRLALKGQLTKWLHAFLCSHRSTAKGVKLSTLRDLAGIAPARPLRKFRHDVESALEQIRSVHDEHLGLVSAEVAQGEDGPKLVWVRRPNRRLGLSKERAFPSSRECT